MLSLKKNPWIALAAGAAAIGALAAGFYLVRRRGRGAATTRPDPCSAANIDDVVTKHIHLDLTVDFARSELSGTAALTMVVLRGPLRTIVLDSRDLRVSAITCNDAPCVFTVGESFGVGGALGQAITITLAEPVPAGERLRLKCTYTTSKDASAAQWLTPAQTCGKVHPYLFLQCQAIHARSVLPCQDSPAVKVHYSAAITAPKPLTALMSAVSMGTRAETETSRVFLFEQKVPIPIYLFGLIVGNVESRELGPRSSVWSEPELVDAAAYEFAETDSFLRTAEQILTPYSWGRYDLALMPSSYPYGGMEIPNMTMLTPTLLAGDRSLVNVVAHEASHSWMGNLVTNRFWCDFWLNEGHTVYIERRILGELHGEAFRQLEAYEGWMTLSKTVAQLGPEHPFTCLVVDLSAGVDPDDSFSSIPYEKGFALLYYLESVVGGVKALEGFLKSYVTTFANRTVSTAEWRAHFLAWFADKVPSATLDAIDWEAWFHKPGMPPVPMPAFDMSLLRAAHELAARWLDAATPVDAVGRAGLAGMQTRQVVEFIEQLGRTPDKAALSAARLDAIDAAYKLSSSRNYEVLFAWCMLGIAAEFRPILPVAVRLATAQGRMKYTRPIYRSLHRSAVAEFRAAARDTFLANRLSYHPICAKMVAKDLEL